MIVLIDSSSLTAYKVNIATFLSPETATYSRGAAKKIFCGSNAVMQEFVVGKQVRVIFVMNRNVEDE